jgi:hypothetical protein
MRSSELRKLDYLQLSEIKRGICEVPLSWARETDPALIFLRFILRITFRFTHRFKLSLAAAAALLKAASPGLCNICYQH